MQYSNEIAVFTLYDAYNYGSFLQAFALQEFINSKGKKAVLIDCSTDKFRWLKRVIAFSFRREYIKIQRRVSYGKAWKKLSIRKYNNAEYFNTAVIGSDEIWNISNPASRQKKLLRMHLALATPNQKLY